MRTLNRLLLTSAAVAIAGCSGAMRSEPLGRPLENQPRLLNLLDIARDANVMHFELPEAAYVAVFDIIPGAAARVVYPGRRDEEQRFEAGTHRVATSIRDEALGFSDPRMRCGPTRTGIDPMTGRTVGRRPPSECEEQGYATGRRDRLLVMVVSPAPVRPHEIMPDLRVIVAVRSADEVLRRLSDLLELQADTAWSGIVYRVPG